MQFDSNELFGLIDIALGIAKDKAYQDALLQVKAAQREYLIAEAECNRTKGRELVMAIMDVDLSTKRFEFVFNRIRTTLSPEAQEPYRKVLESLHKQREHLVKEKNFINDSTSSRLSSSDHIYNMSLSPGDILAVTRKAGLYQHFAVYIGQQRVIHYAAEHGDFHGRITIHEAPFSEFQGNSTMVYVLNFPNNSGYPQYQGESDFRNKREAPFFDLIRDTAYHLYSPEETVARAKSKLGEEEYALPFNNCEHFAIWCKTGVHESHQVNLWISRLADYARKI